MSISELISYKDLSTSNWNTRKYNISRITIHHAAGVMSLADFSSILRSPRQVSWNYAISYDGKIGVYVDERNRAWTSSNSDNDHRAVTIEVSNSSTGGNWPISSKSYEALINLCEDICRRNKIEKLTYTGSLNGSNLTMHKWFAQTACPGPYLESRFSKIANEVNARLGNPNPAYKSIDYGESAYDNLKFGVNLDDAIEIDTAKINELVVTLNRYSERNIDYKKLTNLGVIGPVIEGGYLYDATHRIVDYRNPNLDDQVNNVLKYNLPFGLYFDVRSKSISEADAELYHMSLCLRKYSPILGVWLRLKFNNAKSTNQKILDKYYDQLIKLGFKDMVGLYVTPSELRKIDWSKYKDKFYLWMSSHVASVNKLDELETPQFFMIDNMK